MTDRWYKNYRMEWIAEMLSVYGFINREHLSRKFGISTVQASKDLNDFMRLHPDTMLYDLHGKRYNATRGTITGEENKLCRKA